MKNIVDTLIIIVIAGILTLAGLMIGNYPPFDVKSTHQFQLTTDADIIGQNERIVWTGTGFFVADGYLLTAGHVVSSKYIDLVIENPVTGDKCPVTEYRHMDNDTAILKVDKDCMAKHSNVSLAQSSTVKQGDSLSSIGYPMSDLFNKETVLVKGTVSGFGFNNQIMVNMMAMPGQSGSPVFNEDGAVIGVLTAGLSIANAPVSVLSFDDKLNFAIAELIKQGVGIKGTAGKASPGLLALHQKNSIVLISAYVSAAHMEAFQLEQYLAQFGITLKKS